MVSSEIGMRHLCGSRPFDPDNVRTVVLDSELIIDGYRADIAECVHESFGCLIAECWNGDRERRQTFEQILMDLRRVMSEMTDLTLLAFSRDPGACLRRS